MYLKAAEKVSHLLVMMTYLKCNSKEEYHDSSVIDSVYNFSVDTRMVFRLKYCCSLVLNRDRIRCMAGLRKP